MSAATCSSIGVGVSLLGMPPPLVGQLAGLHPHWWKPAGKGGQGVRRLVQGVMRLLQPTQTPSYPLCIILLLIAACPATPEEADQNLPRICDPDAYLYNLGAFEPCTSDAQCNDQMCMNGYCAEPCTEAGDCIDFTFAGIAGPPECVFYGVSDNNVSLYGCVSLCDGSVDQCPEVADTCSAKAVDPLGEKQSFVCSTEDPCNEPSK